MKNGLLTINPKLMHTYVRATYSMQIAICSAQYSSVRQLSTMHRTRRPLVPLQCTAFVFDSLIQDFRILTEILATDVQDQLQTPRCLSKERQLCGLIVLGVPVG